MTDHDCRMLTQKDAARLIGRSEKVIREWMDSGRLPTIREPGCSRRYVLEITLIEFLKTLESGNLRNIADD